MRALAIPLALLFGAGVYVACDGAEPTALGDKESLLVERYVYMAPVGDCPEDFDQRRVARSNVALDRNRDGLICTKTVDARVVLVDNVIQRSEAASD